LKRVSDSKVNLSRKRSNRAARKASAVSIGVIWPLASRHNTTPQGTIVQRYVSPARMPGDLRPMFGKEYVAFKGGEGGSGWTVRSTKW
jgi:hypothetical protein